MAATFALHGLWRTS
ncbi:trp operon leader peptide [Salmonella enterica]|nr:trp operon leader peptide [Salmonella enterica]